MQVLFNKGFFSDDERSPLNQRGKKSSDVFSHQLIVSLQTSKLGSKSIRAVIHTDPCGLISLANPHLHTDPCGLISLANPHLHTDPCGLISLANPHLDFSKCGWIDLGSFLVSCRNH